GCWYIVSLMAGATTTGARVASTVADTTSSVSPRASFASICAVAGAITSRSARSPSVTWGSSYGVCASHMSVTTGCWERARRVRGETNWAAADVMDVWASATDLRHPVTIV